MARNLLAGNGMVDHLGRRACRAPGYPLFLAGCYAVFGETPTAPRVLQSLIGAVSCLLVFLLAARCFDEASGEIAAWIAAVYPFLAAYPALLLAETLFVFLMLLVVLLWRPVWRSTVESPAERQSEEEAQQASPTSGKGTRLWLGVMGTGLLLGLTIQVRSSLLLYPLFCLPLWLIAARRRMRALCLWLVIFALALLVQVPWTIRNHRIFDRFVPTTLLVGESLLEANGPGADGGPRIDKMAAERDPAVEQLSEYDRNKYFRDKALEWIQENPGRFVLLGFEKFRRFWNLVPNAPEYRTPLVCAMSLLTYGPVLAFGLVGIVVAWARRRPLLLIVTPVVYYSALHSVFVGSTRYRTSVIAFVIVFSARGLTWAWEKTRRRSAGSAEGPSP